MNNKLIIRATISGLIFRFSERFLAQLISALVTIILARILLPEDYGVVSIVTVLINILNVFVTHGLGNSLIQKKDATEEDYYTAFWAGILISVVLYIVIFFAARVIANFYSIQLVCPILRVMAIRIPIAAMNSIQHAYVSKNLLFKKFFFATLISTVMSAIIGITMAYSGFGVWALVAQYVSNVVVSTFTLWVSTRWKPSLYFSFLRFKTLLSFGWKVLAEGLIVTGYDEVRSLIIGKKYGVSDLSFYTKGQQFPQLLGNNVCATLTNVMFPVFSRLQEDRASLKAAVRRSIQMSFFLLLPIMLGFFTVAENFVCVVLTEKWLESVPYIKIFCVVYLFKPLKNINKSALKAIGRADINLWVESAEKILGIISILITMNIGVIYIAYSMLLTYCFGAVVDAIINGRILKYTILEQIKDIAPALCVSLVMALVVGGINYIHIGSPLIMLVIQVLVGGGIYVILAKIFRLESFTYGIATLKKIRKK